MSNPMTPGIAAARLPAETLAQNFADLHTPPLTGTKHALRRTAAISVTMRPA